METQSDVLIVGAFERGWYVASLLASEGLKVTYVDVTDSLGKFGADETRTPFGFYLPKDKKILEFLGKFKLQEAERGLTYLLEDGPVELGSPLTTYRYRDLIHRRPRTEDLFSDYGTNLFDGLRPLVSLEVCPMPSRSFCLPFLSHEEILKGHAAMKDAGVWVLPESQVVDVSLRRGGIEGVEVGGDTSAFLTSSRLVWALSDFESSAILKDKIDKIRSQGIAEPEWLWVNYRFEWVPPNEMVPDYLVVLQDLDLPWCHGNYLIMDRLNSGTGTRRQDCVWVRIPINQRFQKSYLEDLGGQIQKFLSERFRSEDFLILSYPEEMTKERSEKGVLRFGLDSPSARSRRGFKSIRGFYDLSPFSLDNETWDVRLENEARWGLKIKNDWVLEQQKKKGDKIDSAIQPS